MLGFLFLGPGSPILGGRLSSFRTRLSNIADSQSDSKCDKTKDFVMPRFWEPDLTFYVCKRVRVHMPVRVHACVHVRVDMRENTESKLLCWFFALTIHWPTYV